MRRVCGVLALTMVVAPPPGGMVIGPAVLMTVRLCMAECCRPVVSWPVTVIM